jgi:exodeoxyribonuclease VIII
VAYDYDLQAAMYLEGLRHCFGRDFDFAFLPCEKEPPNAVALYGATAAMIARGMRRFRQALSTLRNCLDTNQWPAYQPDGDFELLDWPAWAS